MWYKVSTVFLAELYNLHGASLAVFLALCASADDVHQTDISVRLLSYRTGYSMRTVSIALVNLRRLGFVRAESVVSGGRIRRTVVPCLVRGAAMPAPPPCGEPFDLVRRHEPLRLCPTDREVNAEGAAGAPGD